MTPSTAHVPIRRITDETASDAEDLLAVEEPLEIVVVARARAEGGRAERAERRLGITMRTPGHDRELAIGLLFAEGVITRAADVVAVEEGAGASGGLVRVTLGDDVLIDLGRTERALAVANASCGVCGKASVDVSAFAPPAPLAAGAPRIAPRVVHGLAARLRAAQPVFGQTGALHAAALFDAGGALVDLREDVGRHNAVDKLVGAALLAGRLPDPGAVLMVSGRAGFELVQKALRASIPVMVAVGAPSSLAAELAAAHGMTLVGFARDARFNVYAGAERVAVPAEAAR
ncbi:formate dehydrogenase [Sorangium cellulosum]|uniref:Sulfur carrier protein FdhD n=1 Tax=Sorangium cellulosum TaxID=56 RepID=A0A4P2QE78_SORCE|nr:formate dehydrogenase accessory sulfurtransferase FdhD [Sorangium cellulosum]AUX27718.1 formate dehydrogenase [Sorangium cellulosum]